MLRAKAFVLKKQRDCNRPSGFAFAGIDKVQKVFIKNLIDETLFLQSKRVKIQRFCYFCGKSCLDVVESTFLRLGKKPTLRVVLVL